KGANIGTNITIAGACSRNKPINKNIIKVITRNTIALLVIPMRNELMNSGAPSIVNHHVITLPIDIIINTIAEIFTVLPIEAYTSFKVNSLVMKKPTNNAYNTPIAPASVGVTIPATIPTIKIKGNMPATIVPLIIKITSLKVYFVSSAG